MTLTERAEALWLALANDDTPLSADRHIAAIARAFAEVREEALETAALEVRRLAAIDQAAPKENRWLLVETFPARAHDALSALANKGSTER